MNEKNMDRIAELLIALAYGEISDAEQVEIEAYLATHPEAAAELDGIRATRDAMLMLSEEPVEIPRGLDERIDRRIENERRNRRGSLRWFMRAAAVIALAALVFVTRKDESLFEIYAEGADVKPQSVHLTVYNENLALVKDRRNVRRLNEGINEFSYVDITKRIIPDSVHFSSLSNAAALELLEQNYNYDLAGRDAVMAKLLEKNVVVATKTGQQIDGRLLSAQGGLVIEATDGAVATVDWAAARSVTSDGRTLGLAARPELAVTVNLMKGAAREHLTELAYLTGGLAWHADYVVEVRPTASRMDLKAWITIANNSGTFFRDARVKFVAGDVQRVREELRNAALGAPPAARGQAKDKGADRLALEVTQRSFFEYHVYDVNVPITVLDNQTKQIEFARKDNVGFETIHVARESEGAFTSGFRVADGRYFQSYVRHGRSGRKSAVVALKFKNSAEFGMGIPLPAGNLRFYVRDADDDELEFVGAARIDHTPKDEELLIDFARAPSVLTEFKRVWIAGRTIKMSFEAVNRTTDKIVLRAYPSLDPHRLIDSDEQWRQDKDGRWYFKFELAAGASRAVAYTYNHDMEPVPLGENRFIASEKTIKEVVQ